jgi:hypothetical protein
MILLKVALNAKIDQSIKKFERIGGVMVSVLDSCAVDLGFGPKLGQTKDY